MQTLAIRLHPFEWSIVCVCVCDGSKRGPVSDGSVCVLPVISIAK